TLPQKGSPSGRDIRFELEQMGREFWGMRTKRVRKPTARERAGLLRCIKWIEEELEHLQLRRALKPAYEIMTAWASLLDAWNSRAFQGQADAHRWLLYHRMFRLWMGVLGGELGASRDKYDQPSGPLVCFFEAAVNPILDPKERLGREGIRK